MIELMMQQLNGLTRDVAECYGKPHINAHYVTSNVSSNRLDENATCAFCGQDATNSHHQPPKGKCPIFTLKTPMGVFVLKPALIAVCGSGTTGCHGLIHDRVFTASWEWDDDEYAERWWDGHFLSRGMKPHSIELYRYGFWRLKAKNKLIEWRGDLQ